MFTVYIGPWLPRAWPASRRWGSHHGVLLPPCTGPLKQTHVQRKCTNTRPKLFESFSTRWYRTLISF